VVFEESEFLAGSQNSRDDSFQSDTEGRGGALGRWGSFYSRKGRKGRKAPTGARGRDACARHRGCGTRLRAD